MSEGGEVGTVILPGGAVGGTVHVAGSGSDTQRGRVTPRHRNSGGGVEGGDGDSQLPPFQLSTSIALHGVLHGFRAGRGTSTASLEAKILQQSTTMREEVLYTIFLDLHKCCDAFDRYICLDILEGYGVGPRSFRIICAYRGILQMATHLGGYCREAFQGFRGLN